MTPRIHLEAVKLVTERKAASYRDACRMIAKRRTKTQQPATPRAIRLPYADN